MNGELNQSGTPAELENRLPKQLKIKRLHPEVPLPKRAHPNDAGLDLYTIEDLYLEPGQPKAVRTGLAFEIPDGFVGLISDRSSMGKKGIKSAGGIVDSGYRGEVHVILVNLTSQSVRIQRNDRIAQMLLIPIATPEVVEAQELSESLRGSKGFGSTGV